MARCMRPEIDEEEVVEYVSYYDEVIDIVTCWILYSNYLQCSSDEDGYLNMFKRYAKRRKIRKVTFNKDVKIEAYSSPYCDPTFMVSQLLTLVATVGLCIVY